MFLPGRRFIPQIIVDPISWWIIETNIGIIGKFRNDFAAAAPNWSTTAATTATSTLRKCILTTILAEWLTD